MTQHLSTGSKFITTKIQDAFSGAIINVTDDSAQHAGHAGARSGGGHYSVEVIASQFQDKSAIERHRMIYMALGDAIGNEIHALSIKAYTPEEAIS